MTELDAFYAVHLIYFQMEYVKYFIVVLLLLLLNVLLVYQDTNYNQIILVLLKTVSPSILKLGNVQHVKIDSN